MIVIVSVHEWDSNCFYNQGYWNINAHANLLCLKLFTTNLHWARFVLDLHLTLQNWNLYCQRWQACCPSIQNSQLVHYTYVTDYEENLRIIYNLTKAKWNNNWCFCKSNSSILEGAVPLFAWFQWHSHENQGWHFHHFKSSNIVNPSLISFSHLWLELFKINKITWILLIWLQVNNACNNLLILYQNSDVFRNVFVIRCLLTSSITKCFITIINFSMTSGEK